MGRIYKGDMKILMPFFQAMEEGRIIQIKNGNDWLDIDSDEEGLNNETLIGNQNCFRIKPEPKYRPFKNAEECLKEMSKHTPFGCLKGINRDIWTQISYVHNEGIETVNSGSASYESLFDCFIFFDGKPFGVKVEE